MKKDTSFRQEIIASKAYADLMSRAKANGFNSYHVSAILCKAPDATTFWAKTKKFDQPFVPDWREPLKQTERFQKRQLISEENGHGALNLSYIIAKCETEKEFWERSEFVLTPSVKRDVPAWESEFRNSDQYKAIVVEAMSNGWPRSAVGTALATAKSLEYFLLKAEKYSRPKEVKLSWKDRFRLTEEYAKIIEEAKPNGYSLGAVSQVLSQSESAHEFREKAVRFKSEKPKPMPLPEWLVALFESPQFLELVSRAEELGSTERTFKRWAKKASTADEFWGRVERDVLSRKTDWRHQLRVTERYQRLRDKAKDLGHSPVSVGRVLSFSENEEEFWESAKKFEAQAQPPEITPLWIIQVLETERWTTFVEKAAAFGHNIPGIRGQLTLSKSAEAFWAIAEKRYLTPKTVKERTWRDDLSESDAYRTFLAEVRLIGWSANMLASIKRKSSSEEDFWERAQELRSPRPVKKLTWQDKAWETPEVQAIVKQALAAERKSHSIRAALNRCKSLDEFIVKADKLTKPRRKGFERALWQEEIRESEDFKALVNSAKENGYAAQAPGVSLGKSETPEQFWKEAERFRNPRVRKEAAWTETFKKTVEYQQVLELALENKWSNGQVYTTLGHCKDEAEWNERKDRFSKPNPGALITEFFNSWDGGFLAVNEFLDVLEVPDFEWKGSCTGQFPVEAFLAYVKGILLEKAAQSPNLVSKSYKRLAALFEEKTDYAIQFAEAAS